MSRPPPLAIAVAGCGWIMRDIYGPLLRSLGDSVRVAALCDPNREAIRALAGQFPEAAVFDGVRAMLEKGGAGAFLVLTSETATATVACDALRAGVPAYLEKPPAMSPAELMLLAEIEARSRAFAYTAFNRRHIPLFHSLAFSDTRCRRISGVLKRINRAAASFPATAIHLIDSAQFYGKAPFRSWEISFRRDAESCAWTVKGVLGNGVDCELSLVPDGDTFEEHLVLEDAAHAWELQFPNPEARVPEGELISGRGKGAPERITRGSTDLALHESMGFRACLLDFLQHARAGKTPLLHGPASCRSTIRMMNEMKALLPSPQGLPDSLHYENK